jgi:hypothetical protein
MFWPLFYTDKKLKKKFKKIIEIRNTIISFMNKIYDNKINQIKVKHKNQVN